MNKKVIPAITLGAALLIGPMYCEYLDKNKSKHCQELQNWAKPSGEEKIAPYIRNPSEINIMQVKAATINGTASTSSVNPETITSQF